MSSQSSVFRITVPLLLLSLSFIGYTTTWRISAANGTFAHIHKVLVQGADATLPGTDFPLVWKYTGIAAVDKILVFLVTFFAPAVDGSTEGFAFWGMSQFGAAWGVMLLESLRVGNKGSLVSRISIFGTLIQSITFAVTTPFWLALHLLTSPIAKPDAPSSSVLIAETDLNVIPLNMCLSFVLPSVLMGFPSPQQTSPAVHQLLVAIWQPFPIFTTILQYVLPPAFQYRLEEQEANRQKNSIKADSETVTYLKSSKNVYLFALILCMTTQTLTLYSLYLNNDFVDIFVPFFFTNPGEQVPSLAVGVRDFLQFDLYTGLTAFLVWSTYLYFSSQSAVKSNGLNWQLAVKVAFWAVVSGPMGVVLILLGARDDVVLRERIEKERKDI